MNKIFPITGVVQHYSWGGYHFIPALLQTDNPDQKPFAELWMGTHNRGPAKFVDGGHTGFLAERLDQYPAYLGPKIHRQFQGRLPFLFKVLDVRQMLSIQSHPNKKQAEVGFKKENELGISLKASHRNFKDDNHKPEIMVALTPFWLLHGFKSREKIGHLLETIPEFSSLASHFIDNDIATFYEYIMTMPQSKVDQLLHPLQIRLEQQARQIESDKGQADFWALRAFRQNIKDGQDYDRGIFSIYLFNLLSLQTGESIYQGAGIPHAYLEGINMELMANSDNVFRGGLTGKHIDVPELMKHLIFDPIVPNVQKGESLSITETVFKTPAPDFELSRIDIQSNQVHHNHNNESPQILIVMNGEASINETLVLKRGKVCFVAANSPYHITTDATTTIFKATVP